MVGALGLVNLLIGSMAIAGDSQAVAASATPARPSPSYTSAIRQWPLDAEHLNAAKVWRLSTGAGVVVAVVDSGVDARHPDLIGRVLAGADFTGNAINGQIDLSEDAHGTSVAGVIAATGGSTAGGAVTGLAPAATILPVRVSDNTISNPVALAQGIAYATTHGARVINISICTPVLNPQVRAAVDAALRDDVVVVAAAGNEGLAGNSTQYPAAIPGVLAVAGSDPTGRRWPKSESGDYIGLTAPAVGIRTTGAQGGHLDATGTSFAAPHVAAAAALLRSRYPRESATQIITRLTSTAHTNDGRRGRTPQLGYGFLDPLSALSADSPPPNEANPLLAAPVSSPEPAKTAQPRSVMIPAVAIGATILVCLTGVVLRRRRRGGGERA